MEDLSKNSLKIKIKEIPSLCKTGNYQLVIRLRKISEHIESHNSILTSLYFSDVNMEFIDTI